MAESMVEYRGQRFKKITELAVAQAIWRQQIAAMIRQEMIATKSAGGRVAAVDLYARRHQPHYMSAAMDGIAVCSADCLQADEYNPLRLTANVVNTGQPLPVNCDAVVKAEDVEFLAEGECEITAPVAIGQHVRQIGEDVACGKLLVCQGQELSAADIALLLAGGWSEVPVLVKPMIGVVASGAEIRTDIADAVGEITDTNTPLLMELVRQWGGLAQVLPLIVSEEDLRQVLRDNIAEVDALLIIAGTSAGNSDFTAKILAEMGEVLVRGIDIRPAKPVILASVAGKPVIGMPGYPGSCYVAAQIFLHPLCQPLHFEFVSEQQVAIGKAIFSDIGSHEYVRVMVGELHNQLMAWPLGRGAGLIATLAEGDGYVVIPRQRAGVAAHEKLSLVYSEPGREFWWTRTVFLVGSHDLALDILAKHLRTHNVRLVIINSGSQAGLQTLQEERCHLTGIHMLDDSDGSYNVRAVQVALPAKNWQLVRLAEREQGLLVAKGNPYNINALADLTADGMRFVNRQRGTGTRQLLDYLCKVKNIASDEITGYQFEVVSHTAVAMAVTGGSADCGLAIREAAVAANRDFVSVGWESYDLLYVADDSEAWWQQPLIDVLASVEFRAEVMQLAGYCWDKLGQVCRADK